MASCLRVSHEHAVQAHTREGRFLHGRSWNGGTSVGGLSEVSRWTCFQLPQLCYQRAARVLKRQWCLEVLARPRMEIDASWNVDRSPTTCPMLVCRGLVGVSRLYRHPKQPRALTDLGTRSNPDKEYDWMTQNPPSQKMRVVAESP